MLKLSKFKRKKEERKIMGLTDKDWERGGRPLANAVRYEPGTIGVSLDGFDMWKAERENQPFKTVTLLEKLLKGQPPKWVAYLTLIAAILAVVFSILK